MVDRSRWAECRHWEALLRRGTSQVGNAGPNGQRLKGTSAAACGRALMTRRTASHSVAGAVAEVARLLLAGGSRGWGAARGCTGVSQGCLDLASRKEGGSRHTGVEEVARQQSLRGKGAGQSSEGLLTSRDGSHATLGLLAGQRGQGLIKSAHGAPSGAGRSRTRTAFMVG